MYWDNKVTGELAKLKQENEELRKAMKTGGSK
jgi:hypothetical protein